MRLAVLPLSILALAACGKGSDDSDGTDDTGDSSSNAPTYYEDIAPILSENCGMCHSPKGIQPDILFDDAETTSSWSGAIHEAVSSGLMPPFYAQESEECENPWGFQDDPRLSQENLDLIAAWADAGGPTGNEEDAVPLPQPRLGLLDNPDMEIYPSGKHTTSVAGDTEDEFICFTLDPGLTEQQWLEGFAVMPEDLKVVHHVLVGIDHTGSTAALANEDGTYPCFGGFGAASVTFIGGWIPGATPIEFPDYSATRMEAGSRVVLQMHYHLVDEPRLDGTGIALRFSDKLPVQEAVVTLLGNAAQQAEGGDGLQPGENDLGGDPIFFIPANEESHTETMRFHPWDLAPRETFTFLLANHMHYIGIDMKTSVERGPNAPEAEEICLLHTPDWSFDWQQFYKYDASSGNAPASYPGDALILECEYNNTLSNPAAKKALEEAGYSEPVDVGLGNGTLDEMCILIVGWVFDVPLTVSNATHSGENEAVLSYADGSTTNCTGPAGFSVETDGTVKGKSACGLDLGNQLYTIEYSFTGEVDSSGVASGDVLIEVLYLEDSLTLPWTGSVDGDQLTLSYEGAGVFSNIPVGFVGDVDVSVME
jgi:hypothetical protein